MDFRLISGYEPRGDQATAKATAAAIGRRLPSAMACGCALEYASAFMFLPPVNVLTTSLRQDAAMLTEPPAPIAENLARPWPCCQYHFRAI